jgi:MoaA/NifB/PqqE/SkfB family radical SAM enzyme
MERIVQVTPVPESFAISWKLTTRCNYDCMYCPTMWHDTTSTNHSLEVLQAAWTDIFNQTKSKNLKYKISFSGGEVTSNRHFLPFVAWLRENYNNYILKLLVTTNGSATLKYYTNLYQSIDNISFSVHSEHVDEQEFFDMIVALKNSIATDKFLHVNIMNEFWNQDRILLYQKLLNRHNISYNINEIDYSLQTRSIPIIKGKLNLDI